MSAHVFSASRHLHDGICRFLYFIIALGEALREAVRGSSGIAQLYNGLGPPNINFALGEALREAVRGSSGIAPGYPHSRPHAAYIFH